jgi:hypothetical protein
MTDITRTKAKVGAVYGLHAVIIDVESSVTVEAGQAVAIGTDGKLDLADASTSGNAAACRGLALKDGVSGDSIPVLMQGGVEGFSVSSLDGDAPVYVSATGSGGSLADAAGAVTKQVGVVMLLPGTSQKIIYIDCPWNN